MKPRSQRGRVRGIREPARLFGIEQLSDQSSNGFLRSILYNLGQQLESLPHFNPGFLSSSQPHSASITKEANLVFLARGLWLTSMIEEYRQSSAWWSQWEPFSSFSCVLVKAWLSAVDVPFVLEKDRLVGRTEQCYLRCFCKEGRMFREREREGGRENKTFLWYCSSFWMIDSAFSASLITCVPMT